MGLKKRIKQKIKTNTASSFKIKGVLIHFPPISQSSDTKIKFHVNLKIFIIIQHVNKFVTDGSYLQRHLLVTGSYLH